MKHTELNNTEHKIDQERRSFLEKVARILALVLLGSFLGFLAFNKRISSSKHGSCINDSICSRCKLKSTCIQPQAQSYRAVHNKKDINR